MSHIIFSTRIETEILEKFLQVSRPFCTKQHHRNQAVRQAILDYIESKKPAVIRKTEPVIAEKTQPEKPEKKERKKIDCKPTALYSRFVDSYFVFVKKILGQPPQFGSAEGKSIKEIINTIRAKTEATNPVATDDDILVNWNLVLDNYDLWDAFHQDKIKPRQILNFLDNILLTIKNKTTNEGPNGRTGNRTGAKNTKFAENQKRQDGLAELAAKSVRNLYGIEGFGEGGGKNTGGDQ